MNLETRAVRYNYSDILFSINVYSYSSEHISRWVCDHVVGTWEPREAVRVSRVSPEMTVAASLSSEVDHELSGSVTPRLSVQVSVQTVQPLPLPLTLTCHQVCLPLLIRKKYSPELVRNWQKQKFSQVIIYERFISHIWI